MSDLLKVNVNDHVEKKNGLSYLSWAWAWAEVLKIDPQATWEAHERDGVPAIWMPDNSALVKVSVTIKGHSKTCLLPVMNHRNQAIKNPDAFAINTSIVRCLTKCIAMHGLGLYIYAGEDLPEDAEAPQVAAPKAKRPPKAVERVLDAVGGEVVETDVEVIGGLREAKTLEELHAWASRARNLPDGPGKQEARDLFLERREELGGGQ